MSKLSVNKNKQAQTTIPKELVEALGWTNGDQLLISKVPGQNHIIIENVTKNKRVKQ